ncbi:Matrixin [Stieleria maiorica]|uniref:Matrixin n=1 Tax=Stieleria maiorica TaxID=2795974 RepID=A0A5B9MII3_9BACT|nr:Matrixin [Stieleria maiorica]
MKSRGVQLETLEKRELLAAEIAHAIFAPDTPQDVVEQWESRLAPNGIDALADPILRGSRWTTSALDSSTNFGDPMTLTWGIVPDGTTISNPGGGNEGSSDVVAFMDSIYGGSAEPVIANKPWFPIFENIYDLWADETGLNFVYEPNDDGADLASASTAAAGVVGVRADMRIGGRFIDGDSGILAFNYYPDSGGVAGFDGDMVIDTGDNFYLLNNDGPSGTNTALTNVLAHEVGHGLGIAHVLPVNGTKLMEPFVNLSFYGPQEDDIWNAHTLYGDIAESNDTLGQASDLGKLRNELRSVTGRSIDETQDVDLYRFETLVTTELSIDLKPTGSRYNAGDQTGQIPVVPVDRRAEANLSFRVLDASGVELIAVEQTPQGFDESLQDFTLDQAGVYYIEVTSQSGGGTQLYDMDVRVGRTFTFQPDDGRLRLQSVNPNAGDLFSRDELNVEFTAPTELKFRFTGDSAVNPSTLADGIRISYAGIDEISGTPDDVVITPGFLGFDENSSIVVARFAEPLRDGQYRIEVFGEGVPVSEGSPLRAADGSSFVPFENGSDRDTYDFDLELGARVLSVVPQPVKRDAQGKLSPQRNKIEVYFDDNDLFKSEDPNDPGTLTLKRPEFYQLIRTADTASPSDDHAVLPTTVEVQEFETQRVADPNSPSGFSDVQVRVNRVVLSFDTNFDNVADDSDDLADLPGSGAFRIKVGSSAPVRVASEVSSRVTTVTTPPEVGDTVSSAFDLGLFGTDPGAGNPYTFSITSSIRGTGSPFDYPGAIGEPGDRDISEQHHFFPPNLSPDTGAGIEVKFYNFAETRAYGVLDDGREVFTTINPEQKQRIREAFALHSQYSGIQFIETVDQGLQVVVGDLSPVGASSGGGTLGVYSPGRLSTFNRDTVIMDAAKPWYNGFGRDANPIDSFFEVALHELGHAIGLGHNYELDSGTIMDFPGTVTDFVYPGKHDIVHLQHLYRPDNRDVDFYEFDVPAGQRGTINAETLAERSQAGSQLNTVLSLYKRVGSEIMLLSSNDDSFGTDSFLKYDVNEGKYFIAVTSKGNEDLDPTVAGTGGGGDTEGTYDLRLKFTPEEVTIVDAAGSAIDGDADGVAGGAFNFWFRAHDESRTIYVDAAAQVGGSGTSASPLREIDDAITLAQQRQISSGQGQTVRIVGNAGADQEVGYAGNNFAGAGDNLAYEIGRIASLGETLDDGRDLIVPKGVNVMIDAGSIFKMQASRIAVGSNEGGTDASGASIQVLGVPHLPVFFTSYNDDGVGLEVSPLQLDPAAGDWGGVDLRNDIDRAEGRTELEREGIFLNSVTGADMRFGGGVVNVNGSLSAIAPIQLNSARPTLINNTITEAGSAAISADPSSFEETNFVTPFYQRGDLYTPDYSRIGPVMYRNNVTDNAVNGVLIRIDTDPGGKLEPLFVSARFDDTELVHVLGDDLVINGNPTGTRLQEQATAPVVTTLQSVATPVGRTGLTSGTYEYVVSFVDRFGNESLPSAPTRQVTLASNGRSVRLSDIPAATSNYISRRLYRREIGSGSAFGLVAELDRTAPNFTDSAATSGVPPLSTSQLISQPDGRLTIDPAIVVKSEGVRIETGFGADLIAEGVLGRPVIFTSRDDDRFGTGGTFDSLNDGDTSGSAADWAGIYAGPTSRISLDHARIAYAGGTSTIEGTSSAFNTLQIYQAEARVAHTIFEENASGVGGTDPFRTGRMPNTPAIIFVNGAEPILVDNTFQGTVGNNVPVISVNLNDLNAKIIEDTGRQTGNVDRYSSDGGNHGPLVRGNTLEASGIAGMVVRGGLLATAGVWDDTDIVHVVDGNVTDSNQHTYGGLRLQSRFDESLVVKFMDQDTGLIATGKALDIQTRIGGTLHIIGQPDYPVVLTTLDDDTIGAGFDPSGAPLTDTGGDGPTTGSPGAWQGIQLLELSNDRNVETIKEAETLVSVGGDLNGDPSSAQVLGQLASGEHESNDVLRLGYSIHGSISTPSDLDVYSFRATAGTQIWLDIDRTADTLDSVIELIGDDGTVLAASDNSVTETGSVFFAGGIAEPMRQSLYSKLNSNGSYKDLYTLNPLDAGMRLRLPGNLGAEREYFLRVRSNQQTTGIYQLQIRLNEDDDFAGSTVRHAEIRYAETGIETRGLPFHSPLTGEGSHDGNTINLGNIAESDRGTISLSGNLSNPGDFDRYQFSLSRAFLNQSGNGANIAVTFDVDYADNLGRPNTSLFLYRVSGNNRTLVMSSFDSNVLSDQASPLEGTDLDDLGRGSAGHQDPFLGTVELEGGDYEVVVVNNARIPENLRFQFDQNPLAGGNPLARIEPVNSTIRISADRFGGPTPDVVTAANPKQVVFADESNEVAFTLGDVDLMVLRNDTNNQTQLESFNALSGDSNGLYHDGQVSLGEINARPSGQLLAYAGPQNGFETDANTAAAYFIDPATGGQTTLAGTGLATHEGALDNQGNPTVDVAITNGNTRNGDGMLVTAIADPAVGSTTADLFIVARRGNNTNAFTGVLVDGAGDAIALVPGVPANNWVYRVDQDTGAVINAGGPGQADRGGDARGTGAGTQKIEIGRIGTTVDTDDIVGTAFGRDGNLYAFSQSGEIIRVTAGELGNNPTPRNVNTIGTVYGTLGFGNLVSASPAPTSIAGYEDVIILVDNTGRLIAYDPVANATVEVLSRSRSAIASDIAGPRSLTFSQYDQNLWHVTTNRQNDAGHIGGGSLYFGNANGTPNAGTYNTGSNAHGQLESDAFDLSEYDQNDQPMLYFSYLLSTEDLEALNNVNSVARDSLRVFVSSEENRQWTMVATNNTAQAGTYNDPGLNPPPTQQYDEFDVAINGYRDENGKGYVARRLYDNVDTNGDNNLEWVQARIPLAPWAGQRDVRIRFDFNTAGETERFVTDLRAVEAHVIMDAPGDRAFTLRHDRDGVEQTFEFDLGTVIQAPSGAAINLGDQLFFDGLQYTFTTSATPGPREIRFAPTMSAADVANSIIAAIAFDGINATRDPSHDSRFSVSSFNFTASTFNLRTFMRVETPGVAFGNVPVPIAINASVTDVQLAMQTAIAEAFNQGTSVPADTTPYQLYRDSVRMHGFTTVNGGVLGVFQNEGTANGTSVHDAGVYPNGSELNNYANSQYGGDVASKRVPLVRGERADNNNFEGVYLDDIIIGFAERGEVVTDASTLADVQLVDNPFHEATTGTLGGFVDQVDSGEFQLNIRLSHEYAEPFLGGTQPPTLSFDTNDVLGESVSLQFGTVADPLSGGDIPDGTLIFIADERRQLVFEFDNNDFGSSNDVTPGNIPVTYESTFTATQIAAALVDAINDPNVQADFDVFATMSDGTINSDSGLRVFLEGPVAADLQGGANFAPTLPDLRVRIYGGEPDPVYIASPLTTLDDVPLGFDGGDSNSFRDQGQIILKNNVIVDSSNYGIDIDAGPRRADLPSPGASQAYTTNNPDDLVPGVVVLNSVLIDNANAGIRLGGDTVAISNAPNQFARIINNTIVGGQNGVLITEGASPTLINNAIANANGAAIQGNGAGAVEIFATLFLGNGNTVNPAGIGLGAFPVIAAAGDPVFVDIDGRDLYPEFLSLLIDNSVGAVNDRLELAALRTSLGLAESPIIAPVRDITGQPRAAAPNNNGGGTGNNIFIDIGAFDRSDLIGPFATLIDPLDNGSIDADVSESFVRVISGTLDRFEIQLLDERGVGLDDTSVAAEKLNLSQDGRLLIEGVDYIFGFSATNNTILLTPITGIWNPNSAYEITLNNRDRLVAAAPSGAGVVDGDQLPITDADGNTVTFEFDSGFVLSPTGNPIVDGDTLVYRAGNAVVQFEFNDTDLPVAPTHPATSVVINFSAADTPEQIAANIATAFKNVSFLNLDTARDLEGDRVYLGGQGGDILTVNSAGLALSGSAGVSAGAVAIPFLPSNTFAAETMAGTIIARIVASNLNINGFTPGGGLVYLEGVGRNPDSTPAFSGLPFTEVSAIDDKAGNSLEPNRNNRETQFTILMPGVRLDFGDAFITGSRTYPTTLAQNGARHTIGTELSPRLGSVTDSETDSALLDDAVVNINSVVGSGGLSGTLGGNVATITVIAPASGDTLRVDVGGAVRTYELVLATQSPQLDHVPVLFIPGEPDMNTAERLAKAVSEDLEAIDPLVEIEYERQTTSFTIASLDDEEGVLVGSVDAGGGPVDGLFLDVDGSVLGFLNPLSPGGTEAIVNTTGNGLLDAWVDFNGDGDFQDPGEKVLSNQAVLDGTNRITIHSISDPAILNGSDVATTWMRFRISNTGNSTTNGVVIGGEVEDYRVLISNAMLPTPIDDQAPNTPEDTAVEIVGADLLTNDLANGVSPLGIEIEQNVVNGTLVYNNDPQDPRWIYTPDRDFYGNETFTYRLTGTLVVDGQTLPVRSSTAATVTITVVPVNDQPQAADHNQFQVDEPVDAGATSLNLTSQDLLIGAVPKLPLTPLEAQNPGSALVPPWDESEQTLTVIQIAVIAADGSRQDVVPTGSDQFDLTDGTYSAAAHVPDGSGGTIAIGLVTAVVSAGEITDVRFAPTSNYNQDNPVVAAADDFTFIYTIADDAATTLPQGGQAVPLPTRQTAEATVSVQVIPQNDSPVANDDRIAQVAGVRLDEDAFAFRFSTSEILGNDTAGPPTVANPFFLGTDDEISGANIQYVELVTQFEPFVTVNLGNVNAGIAVHDNALGTGYVMYSPQNVYARFPFNPPPVLPAGQVSDQMIAVRYNGFTWQYSNDTTWVNFTPIPGDRLIAALDFDNNQITGLKYAGGSVAGIPQGYYTDNSTGELNFVADQFGGTFDAGEFTVTGSQFKLSTDPNFPLEFRPYESRLTDQGGSIDYDSTTGELVYTPAPDFYGIDTFTYVIRDVPVDPNQPHQTLYSVGTVSLEVYPVNDAPLAQNQLLTIEEDQAYTVTAAELLVGAVPHFASPAIGFPQDESGQSLSVVSLTVTDANNNTQIITSNGVYQTVHGTVRDLVFNGDGSINQFVYQPNQDFNVDNPLTGGARTLDQFQFTIQDSDQAVWPEGGTRTVTPQQSTATVSFFVTPQNDQPDTQADKISAEPGSDWANFYGGDPNQIPVPQEGSQNQIVVPLEFLLANDNLGPATAGDEINGVDPLNDTPFSPEFLLQISLPTMTTALGGSVQLVTSQQGKLQILYTPPEDAFGVDTFVYTATDRGIDEAGDGTRVVAPLSSNGTVSILVQPTNDAPVSHDRQLRGVEDTVRTFDAEDLLGMTGSQPTLPIAANPNRDPLYGENEQIPNLRVTAIIANGQEIRTSTAPGSPISLGHGTLDLTFAGGVFVSGVYTPTTPDNNELISIDRFQYIVADDGVVAIPDSGAFFGESSDRVATLPTVEGAPSNVTLPLTPVNDDPVFNELPVNILERDDTGSPSTVRWANQIMGGPATALDEQGQVVHFQLLSFNDPDGLFWKAPNLDRFSGSIDLFPDVDQFGQATFVVGVNDSQYLPGDPAFQNPQVIRTITVNLRPVNDAPRINPVAINVADTNPEAPTDDAYSVGPDATISYTLKENNVDNDGNPTPYVIQLTNPNYLPSQSSGDYQPPGLLDVFVAGPGNEISTAVPNAEGGSQTLSLVDVFGSNNIVSTDKNGTLEAVRDNQGNITSLLYRPAPDFNFNIGGLDTFRYSVTDDGVSFINGQLARDPRTIFGRVSFNIQPVNSRPVFDLPADPPEALEDAGVRNVIGFATGIRPGAVTATDETSQGTKFHVTPTTFDVSQMSSYFTQAPTITRDGTLTYRTAPDVFGTFEFEVHLCDNGLTDSLDPPCDIGTVGATDRGDVNRSDARTFTLSILPVNDAPVTGDGNPPPAIVLDEDTDIVLGFGASPGGYDLLGAYVGGPANEVVDTDFAGNPLRGQTVSLVQSQFPATTQLGVSLQPVMDAGNNVIGYRYEPPANYAGGDQLVYTITDDGQSVRIGAAKVPFEDPRTRRVTVPIVVNPINDPPVSNADDNLAGLNVSITEGDGLYVDNNWMLAVAVGPFDAVDEISSQQLLPPVLTVNSSELSFTIPPTVQLSGDKVSLRFEADENAFGLAEYVITLTDDGGTPGITGDDESTSYTFTIAIEGVNDPPTFDASDSISVMEDSPAYSQPWATNIDVGPRETTQSIDRFEVSIPAGLEDLFSVLPTVSTNGILSFTPAPDAAGRVVLSVVAVDSDGGRSAAHDLTITIQDINDAPDAVDDPITVDEDSIRILTVDDLISNDTDPDLNNRPPYDTEVLSVSMAADFMSAEGAHVTFNAATGVIVYDPTTSTTLDTLMPGQSMLDTFTYTLSDGEETDTAVVTLTVTGTNDAPRLGDDAFDVAPDQPTVLPILANDIDVDGTIDPSSIIITTQPTRGALEVDAVTGRVTYTPLQGFRGTDQFQYTVADLGGQQSEQATVNLRIGSAPVTQPIFTGTAINLPLTIAALDDVAGQPVPSTMTVVTPPTNGTAQLMSNGDIHYTPGANFTGKDTIVFTVADPAGFVSGETMIDITVVNSTLQNPVKFKDVNANGEVTPLDALLVINRLGVAGGSGSIPVMSSDRGPNFYDANGDLIISSSDALSVINELALQGNPVAGEGEAAATADAVTSLSDQIDAVPTADTIDAENGPLTAPLAVDKVVSSQVLTPVDAQLIDTITADDKDEDDEDTLRAIDEALAGLLD